jgi:SAM-dependent methyltransferase
MAEAVAFGGHGRQPSWYLDPLVAAQKRREHLALVHAWSDGVPAVILKTDLFEEAHGADELMSAFPPASRIVGMDVVSATVDRARARRPANARFIVSDVRRLALAGGCVDLIVSNSTLDHFERPDDLEVALRELVRVLRPGGRLIVTLDNPRNPLYGILRWVTRRHAPLVALGHTLSLNALVDLMRRNGVDIGGTEILIHNPRLLSTGLFLALRRTLGRRADAPIRLLLGAFSGLARLPTREYTACFVAVCARKPV